MAPGGGSVPEGIDEGLLTETQERQRSALEVAERRRAERALQAFGEKVGISTLRGAVLGAACAAAPGACPAILAVNTALKAGNAAAQVYEAYRKGKTDEERIRRASAKAAEVAASTVLSELAQRAVESELRGVADAVGIAAMASGAGKLFHVNGDLARLLFAETTYQSLKEGLGGFISWGVGTIGS